MRKTTEDFDRSGPLWFPYAQMATMSPPLRVGPANGVMLCLEDGRQLIDSISSWWSVIHGYNHPAMNQAITEQLGRMAHVMLGGLVHEAAESFAGELVKVTPGDLNHVFFSDSGSVAVEVAMKMAVQYWQNYGRTDKTKLLALRKAYHGDTTGAMSVCDPHDSMHHLFHGLLLEQVFVDAPTGGFDASDEAVDRDSSLLRQQLDEHHEELAAMIVEPLMQCAGGFNFYSPKYLAAACRLCEEHEVLMIFDEVATGFCRTGELFAADHANLCPDIMVLGKALTGGYLGHAATIARDHVFAAFCDERKDRCFMHGPTFMGNPLACAAGLQSLQLVTQGDCVSRAKQIEHTLQDDLLGLEHEGVRDVRVLGACGVIEVIDSSALAGVQAFAAERGVWLRPFDRYLYTMPAYVITDEQLHLVTGTMRDWIARAR